VFMIAPVKASMVPPRLPALPCHLIATVLLQHRSDLDLT
jgi:hypothetical protein